MYTIDLSGIWQCTIQGTTAPVSIPGTLDESRIGFQDVGGKKWHPDTDVNGALYQAERGIQTRLTRVATFEGPAQITREIKWDLPHGKRVFLEVERSRHLTLRVNDCIVRPMHECSISTPYVFEVTDIVSGHDEIEFISDNSYPGWPHDAIVFSSAATDETQTNWNGLLGYVRLRIEEECFIQSVRVYPHGDQVDVCAEVNAGRPMQGRMRIYCEALSEPYEAELACGKGIHEIWRRGLQLREDAERWDEEDGILHELTVSIGGEAKTVRFGVRDFRVENGCLTLNGRRVFLRSEANCAVFPETGHPPMEVPEWKRVLGIYRSYGVNMMRFHSHTPPEAAFTAADEIGMMMQPELGHWNPETAFESDESYVYYRGELEQTLRVLANHPSFVMLTLGNELACHDLGHERMEALLDMAHAQDPTRLYACASNAHYGWYGHEGGSDFYTSASLREHELRATYSEMQGYLNHRYPNAANNYEEAMARLRAECDKPVFSFEVGQYEVLPDFAEIEDFHGVTRAVNYEIIQNKVRDAGLLDVWPQMVEATGELSNLCYREEIEAALRTEQLSGISLLGLQDFPGQGTALVGMLNAHLQPKPYPFAQPERFRAFFRSVLPLALLQKYTYEVGEKLEAPLRMANYGREDISCQPEWSLSGDEFSAGGTLPRVTTKAGALTDIGRIEVMLNGFHHALKLMLTVRMGDAENSWPVWVYPPINPVCPDHVYECRNLNDRALSTLRQGGTVFLAPDSTPEAIPSSIQAQFTTDFWSVGTFPKQEGGMGQLIDASHPIFSGFPTDRWSSWQWWPMASQRAMILPKRMEAIITEMDSYAYLRPMAKLLACRCEGGRLLISSMGLHNLQAFPEARALLNGIYEWLEEEPDMPEQTLTADEVRRMIR